ncbi:hypothetical protein OVA24_06030 [Luteolibacter sp. SL250]|uniref:hypothetical protein n=1 Tax=Luteolibacter sp. SL250 TaxID=2995170 RepID=UPI00226D4281|nr:hypothetical protein [Luteolibacter sp. SL250]WAC20938.1 hypothetical protein OVA24_06030 [Luteolibacter sp. SL250]
MKSLPLLLLCFSPPWLACAQEPSSSGLPALEVLPQDILSTRTVHDGLRDVTLQKLDPAAMEDQRLALPPAMLSQSAPPVAEAESVEETPDSRPVHTLVMGASVYMRVLLDVYRRDPPLLRARYEAYLAQAAAAAAERAANPPERKPVAMRYWRADEAAIRAAREGGTR